MPYELPDAELKNRASELRLEALRGDKLAARRAQVFEAELRRRFGIATTMPVDLDTWLPHRQRKRPWWKFW